MKTIKCSKCKTGELINVNSYQNHLKNVHGILIKPMNIHEYIKSQKNKVLSKDKMFKNKRALDKNKLLQNEITNTIKIAEISKRLKVGHELVIDIINNSLNFKKNLELNSKVEFKYLDLVNKIIQSKPNWSDFKQNKIIVFNGLNKNNFLKKKQIIEINNISFETNFSDNEAIEICKRMSDGVIRKAANSIYQINNINERNKTIYQFHKLAMKALKYYGGHILTFILNSNILRSKNSKILVYNGKIKFTDNIDPTFPNIHFSIKDEKYFIRFNRPKEDIFNSYQLTIYNKNNYPIYGINKENRLIKNFEDRPPYINMFLDFSNQINPKIYFGYDNTQCDICGRELTDAISIKYGRGPNCRYYNPL
jgi:hypothetical protein